MIHVILMIAEETWDLVGATTSKRTALQGAKKYIRDNYDGKETWEVPLEKGEVFHLAIGNGDQVFVKSVADHVNVMEDMSKKSFPKMEQ